MLTSFSNLSCQVVVTASRSRGHISSQNRISSEVEDALSEMQDGEAEGLVEALTGRRASVHALCARSVFVFVCV